MRYAIDRYAVGVEEEVCADDFDDQYYIPRRRNRFFCPECAEYAPKKHPVKVLDHDFPLPENGKAVPYGVYDIINNAGYVNVGISKDTAEFAVQSIRNWRGKPLETIAVIINLISSTSTDTGLKVKCSLDTKQYQTGIKIDDEKLEKFNIVKNDFHGEWNDMCQTEKT